jgi:acyl dehydratase
VTLDGLIGHTYTARSFLVRPQAVAEFVAATRDDPMRWGDYAPPGFAAALLFAVAPAFLDDPVVVPHCRTLLHLEQSFSWELSLRVGEDVSVRGSVQRVRTRGPLHFVTFEVVAGGEGGLAFSGESEFVLSAAPAASSDEEEEPPPVKRAPCDPLPLGPLPRPGEALPPLRRSVSRADLLRYAAATGDDNAIHTDHATARAAGLPGVIAHGLLVASWFFQAAARCRPGLHPLASARVKFRRPLRPGIAATVTGRVAAVGAAGADMEMALGAPGDEAPLATAAVRVTP